MAEIRFDSSMLNKSERRNQTPYWGEHSSRYIFAAPYVAGLKVLDIACGTGFGLTELNDKARFVVGADLDFAAVTKAKAEVNSTDTSLVVANGCTLPFADASFEAITSFETLEHLEDRKTFLSELSRVLSPNGFCIISTPNANYTRPINGKPRNPHHFFEYTPGELLSELCNYFQSVELFGQHLDDRFVIPPFWDDQQRLPRDVKTQSKLFLWRVLNKFPPSVRDQVSQVVSGHPFYPGDEDYHFHKVDVESSRVLLALCRSSSQLI